MCTVSVWMGGCVCWGVVLVEENMRYLSRNLFKYFSSPPLFFFFFCAPCKPLPPPPAPYLNEVANKSLMPRAKS